MVESKANSGSNFHDGRKIVSVVDDKGATKSWVVGQGGSSPDHCQSSARVFRSDSRMAPIEAAWAH